MIKRLTTCAPGVLVLLAASVALAAPPAVAPGDGWCQVIDDGDQNSDARLSVPRFGPGPKHRVLYLHHTGASYIPSSTDDSATNRSRIVAPGAVVPPFEGTSSDWAEILACVQALYAPFAIEVTDIEPPPEVDYIESVLGGRPEDIGYANAGGVSSGGRNCNVRERGINFTFSQVFPNGPRKNQRLCEVIGQESGHNFALVHQMNCLDPMTYLQPCGNQFFQDADVLCGEFTAVACRCGGTTQNTHQILLDILGPADDVPPQVSITEPVDQAAVSAGFDIVAEAMDDVRIDRVEFFIDGVRLGSRSQLPYLFRAPLDLAIGQHSVEVRAVDGDENLAPAGIMVNLAPQCETNEDCSDGSVCEAQRCLGGVGVPCSLQGECASELCYRDEETQALFCTTLCDSSAQCPGGYSCIEPEFGFSKCLPGGDGGCSIGGNGRRGTGVALFVFLGALFVVRRRRR